MKKPTTMEVYLANDGWRWRTRACNGLITADCGGYYISKRNAWRAAERHVLSMSYVRFVLGRSS